jgi:hypothetical protein
MLFNKTETSNKNENIVYYGSFTFNILTKTIVDYRTTLSKNDKVVIPEKINGVVVENIGDYAFRKKGITSMNIAKTIKHFGRGCFVDNDIDELIVPEGIVIPDNAFEV